MMKKAYHCLKLLWIWDVLTVVLEILESPLDCKEIKPVYPKGSQSWIFIGRTDAEGEALILWPPDAKNWLVGKEPDARKDWSQEKKGTAEDEMVGWHHWLNGNEFEEAPGIGDGQASLACATVHGVTESDMTEQLNWLIDWFFYKCISYLEYQVLSLEIETVMVII